MAMDINDQNFNDEVLKADGLVLVDFWAPWCGPCKMLGPIVEDLAKEFEGKVKVVKLNVDENPVSAGNYEILSIPALKFFKGGQVVNEAVGLLPRQVLVEKIQSLISK